MRIPLSRRPAANGCVYFLGCLAMLVGPGSGSDASAQPTWHNLDAGEHGVGFRLLEEHDDTRIVGVPRRRQKARPIRIYLWYPAAQPASPRQPTMRFGRYAALADGDLWPDDVAGPLHDKLRFSRHALARSLGPDGFEVLGEQSVRAFENAEPLSGPFPLIVIGQGLYYESPIAFAALSEYLAGRGFVVATCPLMGTHTPIVKLDAQDLETQVRDMEFVIARVRAFPNVSQDALGVMGFDMGGMAGLILAMRNPSVDAFASLSSGILFPHPSGLPAASPDYDPLKLRTPWFHAGPQATRAPDARAPSLFDTAGHSERYHFQIDDLHHVDPTSYARVEGREEQEGYWPAFDLGSLERNDLLSRYVLEFFAAFLMTRPESIAFLEHAPQQTLEHRTATTPPVTYEQFVDALLNGDAGNAIDEVRELQRSWPEHMLLNDFYLYRLAYSLLYSWGLREESLQLAMLNQELNPSSELATRMLSMNYVERGDYDAAIEAYRRLLVLKPDDDGITGTLEWLQGQKARARNRD